MSGYLQADSLSTDTDVPISGAGGSSTAEAPAGKSDYSAWPWEAVLATVLGIGIPDRTEVTGQPWFSISHNGQGGPGSHLIWTANWDSSPNSGAESIQVYLNRALYVAGGPWDRFLNAPPQALSGAGSAAALPLVPQSFQAARLALAGVTSGIATVAQLFSSLHHTATTETTAFHGNAATVVAELFSGLHGTMLNIYDQMTSPVAYSDSVGAAGDAARAFLTDIGSAYAAWSQFPEHSPLGAVVQVLKQIATEDATGAYVIPDPQNTRYGDLTTDGAWASVEQQAKNIWVSLITGDSGDFGGLDLLGRTALSKLVAQYATTTATIVPIVGPARPAIPPDPVNTGPHGGPPHTTATVKDPGGLPGPGGPPNAFFTAAGGGGGGGGGGPAAGQPGGPGPIPGVASFIARPGGTLTGPGGMTTDVTAGPQAGFFPSTGLGAAGAIGAGGLLGAIGLPVRAATAGPEQTAGPGAKDRGAAGPHGLGIPGTDGVLSGAIGATASLAGRPGGRSREADKGFTGTIGHSREARGRIAGRLAHGQAADGHLAGMTAAVRKAPVAGFSLGSGHGSVLQESAVPVISAKSPGITSSSVNAQLTPAGPAPGEGGPGVIGGVGGVLGRQGAEAGGDGLMMMPPAGMGGGSQQRQERERRAYLPQDEDYWGTEPELPEPAVGAEDRRAASEPEFAGPRVIAGIGAEAGPAASTQTRPDRRMP